MDLLVGAVIVVGRQDDETAVDWEGLEFDLTTIVALPALRERQTAMHVARFEVVRRAVPGIIGLRCHYYHPLLHF
jgi:hypothetical protein